MLANEVPLELRGREASTRFLKPLFEVAEQKGVRPEVLAAGTGCSVAELRDGGGRVAWSSFARFLANLGEVLSDEELAATGDAVLSSPMARALMLPGRLLFSLEDVYRWGARPDAPLARTLSPMDMSLTKVGAGRLRLDIEMKPGYAAVRELWIIRLGIVRSVPCAFGLRRAKVTYETTETSVRYFIELPPQDGLAARVRERVSWLVAARDAATELQRANDDLHARYLEIQREVQARKAAEEQLRAELTLFSASVAHDFRAPLRAINGLTTAVIEDYGDQLDAEAKQQLRRVITSAVHMGELIDALLALSRLARVEMKRERVDLSHIARAVIAQKRADEPTRDVDVEIADGLIVDGDGQLLRTLMEQLLDNAWKFSRHRARAQITVLRDGRGVCVRDDGAGFDMQHLGAIFAPFHRLHTTKEFGGVGIGLAMVDRIVRRHGGAITVTAAPDAGAAFSFTLAPG